MRILAIETSCDETAMAIVEIKKEKSAVKFKILANEISSQIDIHKEYGGVFPALAKREHIKNLPIVFEKVLKKAGIKTPSYTSPLVRGRMSGGNNILGIDAIAVTTGPGLEPALWTGITFAKELNKKYLPANRHGKIPIIPVNHMEGHIFSIFPKKGKTFTIKNDKGLFPILTLLVSGGHTELVLMKDWPFEHTQGKLTYKKLGQTRDDAVGEAFDKVARMLGLPYPGGPEIGKLAEMERQRIAPLLTEEGAGGGDQKKLPPRSDLGRSTPPCKGGEKIVLPRPMINSKDYDFSFSGLKTAVLYLIRDLEKQNLNILQNDKIKQKIAKEFEDASFEVLVSKTIKAIKEYKIKNLIVGGGVSASSQLKKVMTDEIKKYNHSQKLSEARPSSEVKVYFPGRGHTGDNALMIAISGYFQYKKKKYTKKIGSIKANGNLSL